MLAQNSENDPDVAVDVLRASGAGAGVVVDARALDEGPYRAVGVSSMATSRRLGFSKGRSLDWTVKAMKLACRPMAQTVT
jgi:hypothetical protein